LQVDPAEQSLSAAQLPTLGSALKQAPLAAIAMKRRNLCVFMVVSI
jgi:hypothetical protein